MNRNHRHDRPPEYREPRCQHAGTDSTLYRTVPLDLRSCDSFLSSKTLSTFRMYRCLYRPLRLDTRRVIIYRHTVRYYRTPLDDRILFTPVSIESHISHALLRTLIHPRTALILDRWWIEYISPSHDVSICILYFKYCYFPNGFDPPRISLDHLIWSIDPPRYGYGECLNRWPRYNRDYSDKMHEYIPPHRSRCIHPTTEKWIPLLPRDRTEWYPDDLSQYIRNSIYILHYSDHSLPRTLAPYPLYHDS